MVRQGLHSSCKTKESSYADLFSGLPEDQLMELDKYKRCTTYKKGDYLLHEGQFPQGIFCIAEGKVKIVKTGESGKEQIIRLDKKGDVIGYKSLMTEQPYTVSAIALEDSHICFINKDVFSKLVQEHPTLTLKLLKVVTSQLNHLSQRLTDMAQKSVKERVAEALLLIQDAYGFEADGKTLNVVLSREELASIAGTATETTIRILGELKQDQVIEIQGKRVLILKHTALVKLANLSYTV